MDAEQESSGRAGLNVRKPPHDPLGARPTHARRGTSEFLESSNRGATSTPRQPEVIYPSTERHQRFAHESPDATSAEEDDIGPGSVSSPEAGLSVAEEQVISSYGLSEDDITTTLNGVNLAAIHSLINPPPLLNAFYISSERCHRLAQAEGSISADLPRDFITALISYTKQFGSSVGQIADVRRFIQEHDLPEATLPAEVNHFVGAVISLPIRENADEVVIGLIALFDRSREHADRNAFVVANLRQMTFACLHQAYANNRRHKEWKAQQAVVELNRLSHGITQPTPRPFDIHDSKEDSFLTTERRSVLLHATRSARTVLDATSAILLDVSGFKYDCATSKDADLAASQAAASEEKSLEASQGGSPGRYRVEPTYEPTRSVDDDSASRPAAAGSTAKTSLPSTSPARRRPSTTRCVYTKSNKPVPLLVASGSNKEHFKALSGMATRAAIAKYLASVKAAGSDERGAHSNGNDSACPKTSSGEPSLRSLLPDESRFWLATPVLDPFHQPAYLLLVAFEDPAPPLERPDYIFLEQLGSALIAADLRIKTRAINRAQVRLTQRMQHALRTPLHNIVGSCENAIVDAADGDHSDARRTLASVALCAESLNASIADIFDYASMAGMTEPTIGSPAAWPPCQLHTLLAATVSNAISAWRSHCLSITSLEDMMSEDEHAGDRNALQNGCSDASVHDQTARQVPPPPELIVTCGLGLWDVESTYRFRFDVESLARIVSKACANALQATDTGIVSVNLALNTGGVDEEEASETGDTSIVELILTVTDTGTGMSQDFMDNYLFRSLEEVLEDSAQQKMGLAILSHLMSRLGGRIKTYSTEGQGSTFQFIFPFGGNPPAEALPPSQLKVAAIPVADRGKYRDSFLTFCEKMCGQFGATFLGSVEEHPELLDEAQVVLLAGERSASAEGRSSSSSLITSRQGRKEQILLIELPNRGYHDPASSLTPERKSIWIGDVPALQFFRPFVLPDLEALREVFADVVAGKSIFTQEFLESKPQGKLSEPPSRKPSRPQASSPPARPSKESQSTPPSKSPFTVLIVEDNAISAQILTRMLSKIDVNYVQAGDGREGVEQYRKHLPDVILMDINMPIMNGFSCALEIRNIQNNHHPRIIAVSALSLESDKIRGTQCGINMWLTKPLRTRQLSNDIKTWKEDAARPTEPPLASPPLSPPPAHELKRHTIMRSGEIPLPAPV